MTLTLIFFKSLFRCYLLQETFPPLLVRNHNSTRGTLFISIPGFIMDLYILFVICLSPVEFQFSQWLGQIPTESRSVPVLVTHKLGTITVTSSLFYRLKQGTGPAQIQGLLGSSCKLTLGKEWTEGRVEQCGRFCIHLLHITLKSGVMNAPLRFWVRVPSQQRPWPSLKVSAASSSAVFAYCDWLPYFSSVPAGRAFSCLRPPGE